MLCEVADDVEETIDDKKWCVYCHISPSNKRYIGITSKNPPNKRWENGYGYRRHEHFWNAIKLYGWNNFRHEILFTDLDYEDACNKEVELIALFKSDQREFGYNVEPGGGSGHGMSAETRRKISQSRIGLQAGEKNYFFGVRMTEKDNPFYGKKHSAESKEKMSSARKGPKNKQCKPVYSPELNRIFWGAKEVENEFGVGRNRITANCTGKDTCRVGIIIDEQRILTTWMYATDAIQQKYITQNQLDNYLDELKKEIDINGKTI